MKLFMIFIPDINLWNYVGGKTLIILFRFKICAFACECQASCLYKIDTEMMKLAVLKALFLLSFPPFLRMVERIVG